MSKKISRTVKIREENLQHIIRTAERVFADKGFEGTTMNEIAERAELPRANIHYYFPTKTDLYMRVLDDVQVEWKNDGASFDEFPDDPVVALSGYIRGKILHSFSRPHASKVWAQEIIQGAPVYGKKFVNARFKWSNERTRQIQRWMDEGKIHPVDPNNILFCIWATTHYFADFNTHIKAMNGNRELNKKQQEKAIQDVTEILLRGVCQDANI